MGRKANENTKSDESMKIDNDCTNGVGNTGNVQYEKEVHRDRKNE